MCTILLYYNVFPELPIVLAANRDELYVRPSSPPLMLRQKPPIYGGRDGQAGGTWMGVNRYGLWAGIANRRSHLRPDPSKPSRGVLLLDLLTHASAQEAEEAARRIPAGRYNPFHLLLADPERGFFMTYEKEKEVLPLSSGLHILTNLGLDAAHDPRRDTILRHISGGLDKTFPPSLPLFQKILADHGDGSEPVCIHGAEGGTRSATVLYLSRTTPRSTYYFADGPPCTTPFRNCSDLLRGGLNER